MIPTRQARLSLLLYSSCSPFHFPGSSDTAHVGKAGIAGANGLGSPLDECGNNRKKGARPSVLGAQAGNIYCSNPSAVPSILSLANGSPDPPAPKRGRTGHFHLPKSNGWEVT